MAQHPGRSFPASMIWITCPHPREIRFEILLDGFGLRISLSGPGRAVVDCSRVAVGRSILITSAALVNIFLGIAVHPLFSRPACEIIVDQAIAGACRPERPGLE
jgi:hypothetical protein